MAVWETVLTAASEHVWLVVVVLILRSRPAHTLKWIISTEMLDRYLWWKGVPAEERLRLIKHAAELEVEKDDGNG